MTKLRITNEPAYVLHRYDWSESSLILDVLTRHHGRMAIAAKGVKRPTSSFKSVLLPLQQVLMDFGGAADVKTLKSVKWIGTSVMPKGDALLAGCYVNELLMALTAREDTHVELFDAYHDVVIRLGRNDAINELQTLVRVYELLLLRRLGYLPHLNQESVRNMALVQDADYALDAQLGLIRADSSTTAKISGSEWGSIEQALQLGNIEEMIIACKRHTRTLACGLQALLALHAPRTTYRF